MKVNKNEMNINKFSPLQKKMLILLVRNGPMKRNDLVVALNSKRTTVYNNWEKLNKYQLADKYKKVNGNRGRPSVYFRCLEKGNKIVERFLQIKGD